MINYFKKKISKFSILINKMERIKHKKIIHQFLLGDPKDYDRAKIVDLVLQGKIHDDDDHAFIDCVLFDKREHIEFLIQSGANIHAQRDVALIWSCYHNNITLSKFLVENGFNVNTYINLDMTDHNQFFESKITKSCQNTPLTVCSEKGYFELFMYLVDNGADIYIDDEHCLKYSSKNGHLDIVKFLLSRGCDISICKKWANPYILQWLFDYELKTNDIEEYNLVKI